MAMRWHRQVSLKERKYKGDEGYYLFILLFSICIF
jgi:hypothetical protein